MMFDDGALYGEENPNAKLTAEQVREILVSAGSEEAIAARYGVTRKAVTAIKTGRNWSYVAPELPRREVKHYRKTLGDAVFSRYEIIASGCWKWTGTLAGSAIDKGHGYGELSFQGERHYAHRAAWEVTNGPIPDGIFVLHRCDYRRCINPDHLFLGTQAENIADAVIKGRHTHCESHPGSKLDWLSVKAIRADGSPVPEIAARYGMSKAQIYNIKNGSQWRVE